MAAQSSPAAKPAVTAKMLGQGDATSAAPLAAARDEAKAYRWTSRSMQAARSSPPQADTESSSMMP